MGHGAGSLQRPHTARNTCASFVVPFTRSAEPVEHREAMDDDDQAAQCAPASVPWPWVLTLVHIFVQSSGGGSTQWCCGCKGILSLHEPTPTCLTRFPHVGVKAAACTGVACKGINVQAARYMQ